MAKGQYSSSSDGEPRSNDFLWALVNSGLSLRKPLAVVVPPRTCGQGHGSGSRKVPELREEGHLREGRGERRDGLQQLRLRPEREGGGDGAFVLVVRGRRAADLVWPSHLHSSA